LGWETYGQKPNLFTCPRATWILFPDTGKHVPSNVPEISNANLKFPYSTVESFLLYPTKCGMLMQQHSTRKFEDLSKYKKRKKRVTEKPIPTAPNLAKDVLVSVSY